jgi:hypothetical protein
MKRLRSSEPCSRSALSLPDAFLSPSRGGSQWAIDTDRMPSSAWEHDVLHSCANERGPLPDVAYAAGVMLVGGLVAVGGAFKIVILLASHNHQAAIAQTFNFVSHNNEVVMLFGLALLTLTTGGAVLAGSSLPKWLGWASIVIAVLCVAGPIGLLGTVVAVLWLPVTGFVLGAREKSLSNAARSGTPEMVDLALT